MYFGDANLRKKKQKTCFYVTNIGHNKTFFIKKLFILHNFIIKFKISLS